MAGSSENKANLAQLELELGLSLAKDNCNMRYIGETEHILKFRLADDRGYVSYIRVSHSPTFVIFHFRKYLIR